MRIFGIGLHKTGTTTLQECFRILGYSQCPQDGAYAIRETAAAKEFIGSLFVAHAFEAFADSPWNYSGMYRVLNEVFPDSRFILTHRHEEKWFASLLRWTERHKSGGYVDMLATLGCEVSRKNKRQVLIAYRKHSREIERYFAPYASQVAGGKLLVVNWEEGDGWKKLCGFLGKPVPTRKSGVGVLRFPHMLKYDAATDKYVNKRPRGT